MSEYEHEARIRAVENERGGRTRSNGKWSKEVAIMDNGLIGKWSNWIMI